METSLLHQGTGIMHGLLVLDKPAGVTSTRILDPLRSAFGRDTRVGHAGTLDPFATGTILALVGDGTRLCELAMDLTKTYEAEIRFGVATDTLDPEGKVVAEADPGPAPPPDLEEAAAAFTGDLWQLPPAHSALHVAGGRAYHLARRGEHPPLTPRRIRIHRVAIREVRWPVVKIEVRCGAGTYIRALARDLGASLGLPAYLTVLRRTSVGPFEAETGLRLDPLDQPSREDLEHRLVPLLDLVRLTGSAELRLTAKDARDFVNGGEVLAKGFVGRVVVTTGEDFLLGLGLGIGSTHVKPAVVLAAAQRKVLEPETGDST